MPILGRFQIGTTHFIYFPITYYAQREFSDALRFDEPLITSWDILVHMTRLMMRCSDTSISNISDEALPLVSVFL